MFTQAATTDVDNLLAAQASPENPSQVDVSQPSDALSALGATRGQIRIQFLAEAILLSLAGGVIGVAAGAAATAVYAQGHGEAVVIPPDAWAGGLATAIIIGTLAGLLPAIRAARLSPTRALWSI